MVAQRSSSHDGGSGKAYEVFLNFRGPDTRLTIVDCLYHALIRAGIRVFKDNEDLRVGEEIGGSLLQAINDSRIYITIFSKQYAESKWPLHELAHMMDCRRRRSRDEDEKVIIPIFFDVDADDVKLKTDLYQKALQEHDSHPGKDSVKQWEEALREVGKIKGRNLKDHGLHELINLKEALSELWTRHSGTYDRLVGIKYQIDEIMMDVDLVVSDVRSMAIHGMGGIGKTSLVSQISPHFQVHCSFLKDIRSRELSSFLNLSCINLSNLDEGTEMIKKKFHHKKILRRKKNLGQLFNKDEIMKSLMKCYVHRIVKRVRNIKLQKLPDSIGQLQSLIEPDVQLSKITELPRSTGDIKRLKVLRVPHGELEKLPSQIWIPPKPGSFKINFDGSFFPGEFEGSVAAVCRDQWGIIINGFARTIPAVSAAQTKTLALLLSLQFFKAWTTEPVIFEGDYLQLIRAVELQSADQFVLEAKELILDICKLLSNFPNFRVAHCLPEANYVAGWAAKAQMRKALPANWLSSPPRILLDLLCEDSPYMSSNFH